MGRIGAVFKADGDETARAYSVSAWWLEPNTKGPGAHAHPEDDAFYVLEGTMTFLVGETWVDVPAGSFVLAPGGVTHDFENRSDRRAGVLNFFAGPFEHDMPGIAAWFASTRPTGRAEPRRDWPARTLGRSSKRRIRDSQARSTSRRAAPAAASLRR